MIILGMAGHVDHGKTALVQALTGMDTDRLPEEKARGMTTDLGFAAMRLVTGARALDIGVIDVPGHERYIRNMVAGAWALDLALLVVAADDGWMEQTENHSRVLAALGPPRVLIVVTKIDKTEGERAAFVEKDALGRALVIFGADALVGARSVSARAGSGLESLKSAIAGEGLRLEAVRERRAGRTPFLFVDRVFTRKGSGLIACGTLLGGTLSENDEVRLLPADEALGIKTMESLGKRLDSIQGPARVALNVKRPKSEIRRGDLLLKVPGAGDAGSAVLSGAEFLIKVEPLPSSGQAAPAESRTLKKGGEIEIAVGTAGRIAAIAPLGRGPWYRLVCRERLALPAELPLALIRQGGAEILGRAWVLREGAMDRAMRKKASDALLGLESLPRREAASALSSKLAAAKKAESPEADASPGAPSPLSKSAAEAEATLRGAWIACLELAPDTPGSKKPPAQPSRKDMDALCAAGIAIPIDRGVFLHREAYAALVSAVLKGKRPGDALSIGEAKERTGFSRKFVIPFLNRLERDGYVKRNGDDRVLLKPAP